jgi:hypothetical protein
MYYQTPLYFVFVFGRGRDRATCVHRTPGLATYTAALGWARAYGAEHVRVDTHTRTLYRGLGAECPTTEPQLPTPPERPNVYLPTPVPPPPAPWLASVELPDVPELNAPCQSEAEARALFSAWCVLIDHLQLWGHPCRARLWAAAPMAPSFDGLDMPGPHYMLLQTFDPSTGGVAGPATVRDISPPV